jgi:hypothetical protein
MKIEDSKEYKELLNEARELKEVFGDSDIAWSKFCELMQFKQDYNLFPELFKLTLDEEIRG